MLGNVLGSSVRDSVAGEGDFKWKGSGTLIAWMLGGGRWFELKRAEDERLRGVCGRGWYMLDW